MLNFTVDIASYEKEEEYKKRISQNITEFHFLVTKRSLRKGEKKEAILSFEFVHGTYRFIFASVVIYGKADAICVEHLPHLHTW